MLLCTDCCLHAAGALTAPMQLEEVRAKLCAVYPAEQFNKARKQLDPHNIMSNEMLNDFFGKPQ